MYFDNKKRGYLQQFGGGTNESYIKSYKLFLPFYISLTSPFNSW